MPTDETGLTDEIIPELNPEPTADPPGPHHTALPRRPGLKAPIEKWIDYCVGLGADRTYITSDTVHYVGYVTEPPLTQSQLITLADQMGG